MIYWNFGFGIDSGNQYHHLLSFDPLLNIVLDDCIEHLRDPDDPFRLGS